MYTFRLLFFLIDTILGIVEFFIGLRILLKLFGANPSTPFVMWVYETSRPLLAPFAGMFPAPSLSGGFVIEFSALFALILYGFVGVIIEELLQQLYVSAMGRQKQDNEKK